MGDVTILLAAAKSGESGAEDRLWQAVYAELRLMAGLKMAREKRQITYQATVLVHEAWLRLASPDGESPAWENRSIRHHSPALCNGIPSFSQTRQDPLARFHLKSH